MRPVVAVPVTVDPEVAARSKYGATLHNARQLISAGLYSAAESYLRRIVSGAPGTRIAAEALAEINRLPVH